MLCVHNLTIGGDTRLETGLVLVNNTAANKEYTAMATDKDEIQELNALVEELQAQVLSAGRLAGMVASWAVASPEVAVEGGNSAER